MPNFDELKNPKVRSEFVTGVTNLVAKTLRTSVNLNAGVRTEEDLNARLKKGDVTPFQYSRLISEAKQERDG